MNKRNTNKVKAKNNKGFPYKSRKPNCWSNVNQRDKYAVVDTDGNVVEKFRLKQTAWNKYGKDCKIIEL